MRIIIPKEIANKLYSEILSASPREVKGACYAEHIEKDVYRLDDVYVSTQKGTNTFSNLIVNYKYRKFQKEYHRRNNYDYRHHNYIGDWHSHPLFECIPSDYDIKEACDELKASNANFLIQLILKVENNKLVGNCYYYNSKEKKMKCELVIF